MGFAVDNISKLLAGVIGIAGILALLTPSEVPFSSTASSTTSTLPGESAPPANNTPPTTGITNGPNVIVSEQPPMTDEDLVIGQPTIDGNPIVDPNPVFQDPNTNVQNTPDQQQQPGGYAAQPFPSYTAPQSYGLQPQQQQTPSVEQVQR